MDELIFWILSFLLTYYKPDDFSVEYKETKEEAVERYNSIAHDLVDVVFDPGNKPLYDDEDGRSKTVAVMLGVALHESRFYKYIDYGLGERSRGDNGRSWCLMQIMAGRSGKTPDWNIIHDRPVHWGDNPLFIERGFTGQELVNDRKLCFRVGLRMIRWSFSKCNPMDQYGRLRVYASGSCSKGYKASMARMWSAENFWAKTALQRTWNDATIVRQIARKKEYGNFIFDNLINYELFPYVDLNFE